MNEPTLYQTFDSKTGAWLDDRWCETEQEYSEYLRHVSERYGECYTLAVVDDGEIDKTAASGAAGED